MPGTASESFGRLEIESRLRGPPWVAGAALLCATATLGVVVNATAPRLMTSRAPGIGDALRINAGYLTLGSAATTAVVTVAGLLALYWSVRETWPWLILAGVIASLPGEAISVIPEFQLLIGFTGLQTVFALTTAAAQLTLLGVLAGATQLVRIRTAPAGAMLFAAALGAQIFGASIAITFATTMELRPGGPVTDVNSLVQSALQGAMALGSIGGMMLLIALHRIYGPRPELDGPAETHDLLNRRALLAAVGGALLFVPATALTTTHVRVFSTSGCWVLIVGALALAAVAGVRTLAGTVIVALAVTGIAGPAYAIIRLEMLKPIRLWALVAISVIVGAAVASTRKRAWAAAGGCAVAGLLLPLATARPGWGSVLLMALLVVVGTSVVAALGVWLAEHSAALAAPAALGPLAVAMVLGGTGLLNPTREADLFSSSDDLGGYAALLLLAAASLAALEFVRARQATI